MKQVHSQEKEQFKKLFKQENIPDFEDRFKILEVFLQTEHHVTLNQLIKLLEEKGLDRSSDEGKAVIAQFQKDNPILFADVETVADHIDHVVALAGIDHVGLGSDYDGVGDSLPTGLKDVSQYPNLIAVLMERGYSDGDIKKICWGNVARVWRAVEQHAVQGD